MKSKILAFLDDLDGTLVGEASGEKLKLYHIGRSALVLNYEYSAATKDIDVLGSPDASRLLERAVALFGKGTRKATEHGLYLETVLEGWPPVPGGYQSRAVLVGGKWQVVEPYCLDPHDLAATKLRRFWDGDREDIRLLCDRDLLDPDRLEEILEKAYPFILDKDGDEFRDKAFRNLRVVQQYLRGDIDEF